MVGSSNGLACINSFDGDEIKVANPLTREERMLQKLPVSPVRSCWGFGYDALRDDYKVVFGAVEGVPGPWVVQQAIRQAAGDMRLMNPVSLVENHSACRTNRNGQRVLPNAARLATWKAVCSQKSNTTFTLHSVNSFGDDNEDTLDDDIDESSDEETSEYDELPPFKWLTNAHVSKLSKEQKKSYYDELEYREKLFMKKQLKEEKKRRKIMKKMAEGEVITRGDVAYGGSLEATLRDKDFPLGRFVDTNTTTSWGICDKNYISYALSSLKKMHKEKLEGREKARLNFEETREKSPRRKDPERETVFRRLEKGVFLRLGDKEKGMEPAPKRHHDKKAYSCKGGRNVRKERRPVLGGGEHWENLILKQKSSHGGKDLFPTMVMMTLERKILGKFPFPAKEVVSKDPVEIHYIKQKEKERGDTGKDFVQRFQDGEVRDVQRGTEERVEWQRRAKGAATRTEEKRRYFSMEKQQDADTGKTPKRDLALTTEIKFVLNSPPNDDTGGKKTRMLANSVNFTGDCLKQNNRKRPSKGGPYERSKEPSRRKVKRKIEEMLKTGKLSHLIKELKQNNGNDQAKIAKQRITQTFSSETMISFPPLGKEDGTEGPMVIEAEIGGYLVYCMYVDGVASSKILH
ncbi:reverse transcriptase domain-containing protein [Tanacetum coccineum]